MAYTNARQRPSQSVTQFETYLSSLETQLPPSNEIQRVTTLMTRLLPKLQDDITHTRQIASTREDLIAQTTRLENTNKRANARSSHDRRGTNDTDSNTNQKRNKENKKGNKLNDNERATQSRKDKKANASRRSNEDEPRGKTPKSKKHLKTVEYYNCHKKGHYANECRQPKADDVNRVPVGDVENIDAHAVESSSSGKERPSSKTP